MRIFIVGGTGVLGRRVVRRLVDAGHEVRALARTEPKAAWLRDAGAEPLVADVFAPAAMRTAVQGRDVVVNLATRVPPVHRMALRQAWRANDALRRDASRILVDAALAAEVPHYLQESVAFLYADGADRLLDEAARVDPNPMTTSALTAEAQAGRVTEAGGVGVALRFAQFAAAEAGHTRTQLDLAARGLLPLVGDPDGYTSFIHADDAAAAVVAALGAPAGIYNVAHDEPLTRRGHAEIIAGLLGRRVHLPPQWLGALPRIRLQARSQRVDSARLRTATGWAPERVSMREGWRDIVAHGAVRA